MNNGNAEIAPGREYTSKPYLLDDSAAEDYLRALESPARRARPENIHNDQEAARRAGFTAPIAAGEQTYAVVAQFLADRFGMNFLRGGQLDAAFIKPVFYGDRLITHARVERRDPQAVELEVWVENQHGQRVLAGRARVAQ